jgi:3-oxoadipate enol-lactonase
MPHVRIDDGLTLYYELDDFTDPWTTPETLLLIHGVADTSKAWFTWVPQISRRFRVLRPDLRGFGQSSVPSRDYQWSLGGLAKDLKGLLDQLQLSSVHVVGQRVGGSVAMQFAHDYPDIVKSLTVIGGPATLKRSSLNPGAWLDQVQREGVEAWARSTMARRLGDVSPAMREWWIKEMGRAPQQTMEGIFRYVATMDITPLLPRIKAPTLVITSDRGVLASVETVREWQVQIPNSQLLVLPSTAYHLAAAHPEECATAVLRFIGNLNKE